MKNKTKTILIIIGIVLTAFLLILIIGNSKCGDGICQKWEERKGSCPQDCLVDGIPKEFVPLYTELEYQLNKFENNLPATANKDHDPIFAAELLTANSNRGKDLLAPNGIIGANYELDRLEELGVEGVVISINFPLFYPPFHDDSSEQEAYLDFYKKVAESVDSRGMKLIIENNFIFTQEGISTLNLKEFYNDLSCVFC